MCRSNGVPYRLASVLAEWVICDGRAVCILPVVLGHLPNLELMLSAVHAVRNNHPDFETFWQSDDRAFTAPICQAIANLHPRGDRPGFLGFPVWLLEPDEINRLFFAQDGAIETLNRVKSDETETGNKDEFPPYACQDLIDTYLADLTHSLGSFSEAKALIYSQSLNSVKEIFKRLSDLKMGREKKAAESLKNWYWDEYVPQNPEAIDNFYFGDSNQDGQH